MEWHDVDLAAIVRAELGLEVPVEVANDADLGALAEHHRGVGVGVDDLVYISGSIGVGAGVIVGGNQLTGAAGYSGEIGHISFNPRGRSATAATAAAGRPKSGRSRSPRRSAARSTRSRPLSEILEVLHQGSTDQLLNVGSELGRGLAGDRQHLQPAHGGARRLPEVSLPACSTAEVEAHPDRAGTTRAAGVADPGHARARADSVLHGAAEMALGHLLRGPRGDHRPGPA